MRRLLRLSAFALGLCNGYHLLVIAERLVGAHALRDAFKFDPEDFARLWAEIEAEMASGPTTTGGRNAVGL